MIKLKPKQEAFLLALFTERTKEAAIRKADIARNTGYKYLHDPDFKQAYRDMQRMVMQETTQAIQSTSRQAVEVLNDILDDEEATNSDRIRVASIILDNAYKALELDDISARIDSLEELMDKDG